MDSKKAELAIEQAKKRFMPLIAIFSSDLGKDALDLLIEEYVMTISYSKDDPYHTAFLEGQRALVLWIKDVVEKHGE
jgi:hypothetical protein